MVYASLPKISFIHHNTQNRRHKRFLSKKSYKLSTTETTNNNVRIVYVLLYDCFVFYLLCRTLDFSAFETSQALFLLMTHTKKKPFL